MSKKRYRIPSISALQAFESAARHCNFSRAAEELHTSQSAISRHVAVLESRFNTLLFDRYQKRKLVLSPSGESLFRSVVSGFDIIQGAIDSISTATESDQLTVACTHEISHLYLLPRFEQLQKQLGSENPIRVMTYEYDTMETSLDPRVDIVIQYDSANKKSSDLVTISAEAICPVASPAFIKEHQTVLKVGIQNWESLPFLNLSKQNYGWATWWDWFEANGGFDGKPEYINFTNYVYLLEAASAGKGIALGWKGLIERHIKDGVLQTLVDEFTAFDRGIYAILTARGRQHPLARRFIDILGGLA